MKLSCGGLVHTTIMKFMSNPEETTYKKLKDNWNKILEKTINYEDLEVF